MADETKQQDNIECTYKKQTWVDHFVDEAGFVVQQGTAMDALHFNHIEDGIEAAHNLIAEETANRDNKEAEIDGRIDALEDGTTMAGKAKKTQAAISVGDVTFDGSEAKTVTATDGIEITGGAVKHKNKITSGTASGGSGSKSFGGTFTIPSITYDAQGHITGKSTTTITLPSNNASQSTHGLMSTTDKKKLDGLQAYKAGQGLSLSGDTFSLKTLDDMDWDEISAISKAGKAPAIFHVGQEKHETLTTGEKVTFVILGMGHDDLADGSGKAGITFGLKNCLKTTYGMNSSNTNSGGWGSSAMRTRMSTFKSQLPSALQSAIRSVTKKTSAGSQSTTINSTTDDLLLFSHIEVFGVATYDKTNKLSVIGEGKQYDYYKGKTWISPYAKETVNCFGETKSFSVDYYYQENGFKGLGETATSANFWWLRSPIATSSNYFCCVSYSGHAYGYGASSSSGVCFGFCV